MSALRKNVAGQHIGFCLNAKADGTPVTAGGAGTVVIDGGAQAACAGTFTHKGTGQWDYAPTQAETNGASIAFAFTGTGAIQVGMQFFTTAADPTNAVNGGLTALPNTAVTTNASLLTSGTGTDQLHVSSGHVANVDTLTTYTGNTVQTGDNFARLGAPAGASVSADVAAIKADTGTILTDVNTGAGAIYTRLGAPAGASMSADIASVKTSVGAVTGNVGGNVVGSVGSVTAGVTVTTNNDKTGYALTPAERSSVADALLDRDMSLGADTGSSVVRTVRQALRILRNKWTIAAGTQTITKEDDTTTSWSQVVTGTAGANPITAVDPT